MPTRPHENALGEVVIKALAQGEPRDVRECLPTGLGLALPFLLLARDALFPTLLGQPLLFSSGQLLLARTPPCVDTACHVWPAPEILLHHHRQHHVPRTLHQEVHHGPVQMDIGGQNFERRRRAMRLGLVLIGHIDLGCRGER
jgi:hypothetical protein